MRKEVFFAIGAGAILGLIVAFGIWRANAVFSPDTQNKTENEQSPTPRTDFSITLSTPQELDVLTETPFSLSGITKPSVFLAISGDTGDYLLKTDNSGAFEENIEAGGGINNLNLTAFDQDGRQASLTLLILYSSEIQKAKDALIDEGQDTTNATEGARSVRDRVAQKVEEATNHPKAYLGTITDITETGVQLRSIGGEILQAAISEDTTYAQVNTTTKEISLDDIAIGDTVAAMGFLGAGSGGDGTKLLDTKRILVTHLPDVTSREIHFGRIIKIDSKSVTIEKIGSGEAKTASIVRSSTYFSFDSGEVAKIARMTIKEGSIVILFADIKNGVLDLRSLFSIIPEVDNANSSE